MEKLYRRTLEDVLQRIQDGAFIPADSKNKDYVEFLALCDQYGESEIVEE